MELKSLESITLAELKPAKVRKDLKKFQNISKTLSVVLRILILLSLFL